MVRCLPNSRDDRACSPIGFGAGQEQTLKRTKTGVFGELQTDCGDGFVNLRVDKKQIQLEQPLRELGTFMVEIQLKDGTTAAVKTIISEEK